MKKLICVLLLLLSACAKEVGSGPGAADPLKRQGTLDGGGGNGINGVMLEHYIKDITQLAEYKRHVAPLLPRMLQGRNDAMAAYLSWAAKQKKWYFLPVKLDTLSKEQVDSFFEVDQLALHSETRIYIDANAYANMSSRDRALLLLHEMVMGARLLMKKTPMIQCEALTTLSEHAGCRDPEMEQMARHPSPDGDPNVMSGEDHQKVRAMTDFLMTSTTLSGESVGTMRVRLGFVFPWDDVTSQIGPDQLMRSLQLSVAGHERFTTPNPESATARPYECEFKSTNYSARSGAGDYRDAVIRISKRTAEPSSNPVFSNYPFSSPAPEYLNADAEEIKHWTVLERTPMIVHQSTISARGVRHPDYPNRILDRVETTGGMFQSFPAREGDLPEATVTEFYLTRDSNPRVLEFRQIRVSVINGEPPSAKNPLGRKTEYIPLKNKKPTICKLTAQ